jgi:hypothetical protein
MILPAIMKDVFSHIMPRELLKISSKVSLFRMSLALLPFTRTSAGLGREL